MSERYSKLFGLPENLYAEGAPVVISAGALLKDNQTSKMLAQFKFKNISQKQIKALKIKIKAFDVFGVQLEDITEYQYLDLSAPRDSEFGQKQAIPLPYNVTRSISCEVVSAVFADGETWENTGAQWKPIAPQETLSNRLGKLAPQYQRDTIKQAQFVVADERDLWLCACGAINGQSEAKCHACESGKAALLAALDTEKLAQHKVVFDEEEAEKNAKNAAEQKKKKAKTKKICIIAGAAAVVVIAAVLVITMVIVPSGNYNSAVALMNEGKYEEAITAFGKLGDYKDSQALLSEAKQEQSYQDALALLNGGEYEEAISAFEELKEYKDSAAKISEIESMMAEQAKEEKYQQAVSLIEKGDDNAAYQLFLEISGYKDSANYLDKFAPVDLIVGDLDDNRVMCHYDYEYSSDGKLQKIIVSHAGESPVTFELDENLLPITAHVEKDIYSEAFDYAFNYERNSAGDLIRVIGKATCHYSNGSVQELTKIYTVEGGKYITEVSDGYNYTEIASPDPNFHTTWEKLHTYWYDKDAEDINKHYLTNISIEIDGIKHAVSYSVRYDENFVGYKNIPLFHMYYYYDDIHW